jgi:thioredoxin-related protein
MTLETVWVETPAILATSFIVARLSIFMTLPNMEPCHPVACTIQSEQLIIMFSTNTTFFTKSFKKDILPA